MERLRPREAARFALRLTFWLVVLAVPLELYARAIGLGGTPRLTVDPSGLLEVPEPGTSVTYRLEGFARFRFNRDGLRGEPLPPLPVPGELRTAWLGDSYLEALQVPTARIFAEQVGHRLGVSVLNYGLSGDTLGKELLRWRHLVVSRRPALVVLVSTDGDLQDVIRASNWATSRWNGEDLEVDRSALEWNDPRTASAWRIRKALRDRLASYHLLHRMKRLLSRGGVEGEEPPELADKATLPEGSVARYAAILSRLRAEVHAEGAELVGLHLPRGFTVREGVTTLRDAYAEAYARAGVPLVSAWQALADEIAARRWPYHGQPRRPGGHLNEHGHAVVAAVALRALEAGGPWAAAFARARARTSQGGN